MLSNKKLNPIVTELFIRGRNLSFSLVLITNSYFAVSKNIRLNSTHYVIMKTPNKRELQQTAFNHSSDIDFRDFMSLYKICTAKPFSFSLYKICTAKPFSFLVIHATLASDNPLHFRMNLSERI